MADDFVTCLDCAELVPHGRFCSSCGRLMPSRDAFTRAEATRQAESVAPPAPVSPVDLPPAPVSPVDPPYVPKYEPLVPEPTPAPTAAWTPPPAEVPDELPDGPLFETWELEEYARQAREAEALTRADHEALAAAEMFAAVHDVSVSYTEVPPPRSRRPIWLPVVVALMLLLIVAGVVVGPTYLGPLVGGVVAQPSPSMTETSADAMQPSESMAPTEAASEPAPSASASSQPELPSGILPSNPNPSLGKAELLTTGLGPLQVGMTLAALQKGNFVVGSTGACVSPYSSNAALKSDGVELAVGTTLVQVTLVSPTYATRSGARVGMTVAEIKKIYGTQLVPVAKTGDGGSVQVLAVTIAGKEVLFLTDPSQGAYKDSSVITSIVARAVAKELIPAC